MFADGWPRGTALKPILLALATALFIASYTVVDGLGIRRAATPWGYIVWLNIIEGIPFMIGVAILRPRDIGPFLRTQWKSGFVSGVLAVVGYAIVLYALARERGRPLRGPWPMSRPCARHRCCSPRRADWRGGLRRAAWLENRRIACAASIMAGMIVLQVSGYVSALILFI